MALFTLFHVVISLVGIVSGFLVIADMLNGRQRKGRTSLFLATTAATSLTGFLFPFHHLLPSHIVGMISLGVLLVAFIALYARNLAGAWRRVYVVCAVLAQFFNVFVLVAQAFQKIPPLKALAPTQTELPFLAAQSLLLALFLVLGFLAVKKSRPSRITAA